MLSLLPALSYHVGVKNVCIQCYSNPYFPSFGLISPHTVRMWENADQNNSEYGHFLRSGSVANKRVAGQT